MRFASFITPQGLDTWGPEVDGRLLDLGPGGGGIAASLKEAVERGLLGEDLARRTGPSYTIDEVTFREPIIDPGKIICVGVNYRSHQEEIGRAAPPAPTIFVRFADSQMGHLAPAVRPATTAQFDYEGELAVIIGAHAFHVSEADAFSVIAGYSVYNDFTARDWQRATSQWTPGKNFPSTGGFGPYLVPAADISDITALRLTTRVDGEVRQSASLADLVFTIPQIIAHITAFTALSPGDVVVTGTPGGVGLFMDPPRLLSGNEVVEVEITEVGVLRNPVVQG